MISKPNKIRLNNRLWFTVLKNKMVFGDNSVTSDCHYTISFGNRSGYFDLHLTREKTREHFLIVKISHQDIELAFNKLISSMVEVEHMTFGELRSSDATVYQFTDLGDVWSEFSHLIKKDKIIIDRESQDFKLIVNKLIAKSALTQIDATQLDNISVFTGVLRTREKEEVIAKIPLFGNEIFRLTRVDVDFNSVMEKLFGANTYSVILTKIKEGIRAMKT